MHIDCPQRDERLGWMGDVQLSSNSLAINFDMKSFFLNELLIITDEQDNHSNPNVSNNDGSATFGSIPDINPYVRGGGRPGDAAWTIAFPQIINTLATTYNDNDNNNSWIFDLINQYKPNLEIYAANLGNMLPNPSNGGIAAYPFSLVY